MNSPFSQMLPNGDQVVAQLQQDDRIQDVMRHFPEPHANALLQERGGARHVQIKEPPKMLRHLHQGLWHAVDYEAHQVADQTRWMWGKEGFDSTKVQFVGVRPFIRPQPLLRSVAWKDFRRASKDDE